MASPAIPLASPNANLPPLHGAATAGTTPPAAVFAPLPLPLHGFAEAPSSFRAAPIVATRAPPSRNIAIPGLNTEIPALAQPGTAWQP